MAGHLPLSLGLHGRDLPGADLPGVGASGPEPAARGRVHGAGDLPGQDGLPLVPAGGVGPGDGVQQEPGVGVPGSPFYLQNGSPSILPMFSVHHSLYQTNGMVIGTGDMSELALGWATFAGDHISMYG